MASAESQGKTIALVILTVLFIGTSASTWYFFNQADTAEKSKQDAFKQKGDADRMANQAKTDLKSIRERTVGTTTTEDVPQQLKEMDNRLQNPDLSETRRKERGPYGTYVEGLTYVEGQLKSADSKIAALTKEKDDLEGELKSARKVYSAQVAEKQGQYEKKAEEVRTQEAGFKSELERNALEVATSEAHSDN